MFDTGWEPDIFVQFVIVIAVVAGIVVYLSRAFRRDGRKPWPAFFVGIYNILLLLLFLFGMITQVGWEGFGFFPLVALTLPWSWILDGLLTQIPVADINFFGGGLLDNLSTIFIIHNVLAASANSCILYFLVKRHQKKAAADEAWEQARRKR